MRLVSVEQPRVKVSRELMMLDDAEMAFQLNEIAEIAPMSQQKRPVAVSRPATQPMQLNDFLTELYAAASLIMDKAECDALTKELLSKHELVLAA